MDKIGKKNFKQWMGVKEKIDADAVIRHIKEGDIWWSSIGENVGSEICGKGNAYTRPVLVFRKLNGNSFWAIPLTSKKHGGSWYAQIDFNGKKQTAIVSQIQIMSVSRLWRKMGELTNGDYEKVSRKFLKLLLNSKKYALARS